MPPHPRAQIGETQWVKGTRIRYLVDNFGYSATKIFVTAFLDDLAAEIGETCQVVGNLIGHNLTNATPMSGCEEDD